MAKKQSRVSRSTQKRNKRWRQRQAARGRRFRQKKESTMQDFALKITQRPHEGAAGEYLNYTVKGISPETEQDEISVIFGSVPVKVEGMKQLPNGSLVLTVKVPKNAGGTVHIEAGNERSESVPFALRNGPAPARKTHTQVNLGAGLRRVWRIFDRFMDLVVNPWGMLVSNIAMLVIVSQGSWPLLGKAAAFTAFYAVDVIVGLFVVRETMYAPALIGLLEGASIGIGGFCAFLLWVPGFIAGPAAARNVIYAALIVATSFEALYALWDLREKKSRRSSHLEEETK